MLRSKTWCGLALIVLLLLPNIVQAQNPPTDPFKPITDWAGDAFPYPKWYLNLTAGETAIDASWTFADDNDFSAVVTMRRENFPDIYTGSEIDEFVDTSWLDVVMSEYQGYNEVTRCFDERYLVVDIETIFDDRPFYARYWAWSEPNTFVTVIAVYPTTFREELTYIADTLMETAPRCSK